MPDIPVTLRRSEGQPRASRGCGKGVVGDGRSPRLSLLCGVVAPRGGAIKWEVLASRGGRLTSGKATEETQPGLPAVRRPRGSSVEHG